MKPSLRAALTALAAASLCSCSTSPKSGHSGFPEIITSSSAAPITLSQLAALQGKPDLKFEKVRVSMKLASGKKSSSRSLPDTIARRGQPVKVEQIMEFPYAKDFDFPRIEKAGNFPVTPTTPREFAIRNTGLTVVFTATPRGPLVMLKGTVTHSKCEHFLCNPGSVFSPIYTDDKKVVLTDNKCLSPQFTDRITHFHVAALPGQPLNLPINSAEAGASLQITASLPASPKPSVAGSRHPRNRTEPPVVAIR